MGELEDKSLAKRTSIAPGGKIARTGGTYFDPESKVDVYAPQGQFFVEYDNGRVELKPLEDGKVPDVATLLGGGAAGKPLGSSTPGDLGAGDLSVPKPLGELEQRSLDQRTSLGITGDPARVGGSYFDPESGVDVQAPAGKYFVEYAGGGVELRDIPADGKVPTFEQLFAGKTAAKPVGESTPGEGSTGTGSLKLPSIDGKQIKRYGQTFFDPKRGIDVQADPGYVFVEYEDGSVEQRKSSELTKTGSAQNMTDFGASFEELGLNPDGTKKTGVPDNSGWEYIGKEYTAANGQKRTVTDPKNSFYQDPKSRTIVERLDTGKDAALPSTSPSVAAATGDIKTVFKAVFGKDPTPAELDYWNKRTDKTGGALIGAMQFAKQQKRTIGGTDEPGGGGGDPIAAMNKALNAGQMSDFAAIGAATSKVDLSSSSALVEKLTKMLNEKPDLPSLKDEYAKELAAIGFQEDADALSQADKAVKQLDADFATQLQVEEGRQVSMTQVRRRQGAEQIAYDRIRRDLVVERDYLQSKVAQKQAIVNTMVQLTGQDIQNAQAAYQNQFQNALSITNLLRGIEQDALTAQQRAVDNARANVTVMTNLLQSGNLKYDQLSPDAKAQVASMEIQAGLPIGFTGFVSKAVENPVVHFGASITRQDGTVVQPVYTVDPATGNFKTTYVNQGKERIATGGGGGSSGGLTKAQQITMQNDFYKDLDSLAKQAANKYDPQNSSGLGGREWVTQTLVTRYGDIFDPRSIASDVTNYLPNGWEGRYKE